MLATVQVNMAAPAHQQPARNQGDATFAAEPTDQPPNVLLDAVHTAMANITKAVTEQQKLQAALLSFSSELSQLIQVPKEQPKELSQLMEVPEEHPSQLAPSSSSQKDYDYQPQTIVSESQIHPVVPEPSGIEGKYSELAIEGSASASNAKSLDSRVSYRTKKIEDMYAQSLEDMSFLQVLGCPGASTITRFMRKKYLPMRVRLICEKVMGNRAFTSLVITAILANAAYIALSAEITVSVCYEKWHTGSATVTGIPVWFSIAEVIFALVFTVELLLRFGKYELQFFTEPEFAWNYLDLAVIMGAWFELTFTALTDADQTDSSLSFLRVLRVLRIIRSFRLVRVMRYVQQMRLTMLCLMNCVAPLFWTVLCLFLILFVFAMNFLSAVASFFAEASPDDAGRVARLKTTFGSFGDTMVSLFVAITGGDDWLHYYTALFDMHWVYGVLFLIYITCLVFGVLNVFTAIFVDVSLKKAQNDNEVQVNVEKERKAKMMRDFLKLFRQVDEDNTGEVTQEEWLEFCEREDSHLIFSMMGIPEDKAVFIFETMDIDGSRSLGVQEFIKGMMLIHDSGPVDLDTMMHSNKKLAATVNHIADDLMAGFKELKHIMNSSGMEAKP